MIEEFLLTRRNWAIMHNVAFPDMVLTSSKLQVHHNRKRSHLYEYLQQVGHCGYGIVGKMQYYAITYQ